MRTTNASAFTGMFDHLFATNIGETGLSQYVSISCAVCGVRFCLDKPHLNALQRNHNTFYCPNGHTLGFGETEAEKREKAEKDELRQQLTKEAKRRELLETRLRERSEEKAELQRSLSATRGVITRIKNRVANGVCPCCNRHFTNLERHMKGQHPDFVSEP